MEEIEAKFIHIDVSELKNKLQEFGATFMGSFDYKRRSYDFPGLPLAERHAWVRVRDEGDKVVMTYKQRLEANSVTMRDGGMKEIEIEVSDFHVADDLLKALGMIEKFYEENKRERYVLDGVEVDIDSWPMIEPYVELEGSSWESVQAVAEKLGFEWKKHLRCSTMQIYKMNGINENDYSVITFTKQTKKQLP